MRNFKKQIPKDSISQTDWRSNGLRAGMKGKNWAWLGLLLLLSSPTLYAQVSLQDSSISLVTLDLRYRGMLPAGPMAERWGYTSTLGVEVGYQFENGWFLTAGTSFLFSDAVEIDGILDPLLVDGLLVTDNGLLTEARALGQGLLVPLTLGYILPVGPRPNPNSGFFVQIGGQYLRYRFFIEPIEEDVAGLSGEYRKGYDHLVSGLGVSQAIGYRYFDNRSYINFHLGLELSQNVTRYQRSVHFATGVPPQDLRADLLFGFFAGWTFPLYQRAPNRVYYY